MAPDCAEEVVMGVPVFYTSTEASQAIGVCEVTLRKYIRRGVLPLAGTTAKGKFLVTPEACELVRRQRAVERAERREAARKI